MTSAVRIQELRKSYAGRRDAEGQMILQGVSLTAPAGRITTILGESGCGKTTLLRIVAGLEPATSGRVLIGDRDVTFVPPMDRKVAMVFQNYGLYPAKSVAKNIEFPLKMAKVAPAERRARALEVARILHLEQVMDRLPSQLSGGQRQRVGICRAIVRDPEILLMDEPLSNLDAQLRIEMRSELVSVQRRVGSTMMYVTHDQVEAMTMSDLIVLMRGGRIEQMGAPEEIFARPASTYVATFLGNMNIAPATAAAGIVSGPRDADLLIGVRPEHLELERDERERPAAGLVVEGDVFLTELLGTDRILHVRSGEQTWRARIDAGREFSNRIRLVARPENVHAFDAATGMKRAA